MAGNKRRVDSYKERTEALYEFDGSAVRKIEELPQEEHQRKKVRQRRKRPEKNIAGRYSVCSGYVVFLAVICVAVSALCVMYLKQKATITTQYENIAVLENEYTQLKNNNDAKYTQVQESLSIEDIKEAAENDLGMSYAGADQILYYDLGDGSYVRQYKDVPSE